METAESVLRLDASWVDYLLVAIYFLFVLGIGWAAKARVSSSIDFFLSGRGLPAWVTGLAFVSANLGAMSLAVAVSPIRATSWSTTEMGEGWKRR